MLITAVDSGDVEHELPIDTRDLIVYERAGGNTEQALQEIAAGRFTEAYHLAFLAARRKGVITASTTQQQFETEFALIFDDEEDGGPDPTQPAPTTGTPPPSPS